MGEAAQLKQRGEFMKNKQITGNVNQGQWSNYKHRCAIPRPVEKKTERFRVKRWNVSLRNEGMKHPKHQPFRACLINWNQLMRSERRMMSPHHSLVPYFSIGLCFCDYKAMTPNPLLLHTNMHMCAHTCTSDDNAQGLTIRERWGTFSNVSSKCQLKITRVLKKVGSEGTDIFSFVTQQCLSDRAVGWHDGIYFVSSLIHSDKDAPVNINARHPWANM